MSKCSEVELSLLTGKTRATVRKKLDGQPFEPGAHKAKLYDSILALEILYGAQSDGGGTISAAEAAKRLTEKRTAEIELNMEVKRKERIPIEVTETVNDRVFSNVSGMLKATIGKKMTAQIVNEIYSEFRTIGVEISRWTTSVSKATAKTSRKA